MDTKIKQLDVLPLVKHYITELGLHDLFDKHVPNNKGFEIKPAQVLCMMIMNVVVAAKRILFKFRGSQYMYGISPFFNRHNSTWVIHSKS